MRRMPSTFSSVKNILNRTLRALTRAYSCKSKEPGCMRILSDCEPTKDDPCNPKENCCGSERLVRDPCYQRRPGPSKRDPKDRGDEIPQKSVWEYPADCCGNPCPDLLPKFDTLYYRVSDKNKRCYQQTWVDCKVITKTKKKFSCQDSDALPPMYKRPTPRCPDTACEYDSGKLKALCCLNQSTKCGRITMPCCRPSRVPPKCLHGRAARNCQKVCCPYPAYSECCHACIPPLKHSECRCTRVRANCEAYAHLRRKVMYNLPPNLPEWPPKMRGPRT